MTLASLARIRWIGSCLLLLSTASNSWAQEIEFEENVVVVENAFALHETNFDRWVFGNVGKAGSAREHLESLLQLSIGEVDRSCSLSEVQRKKLTLAGKGDIKHFLDRLADARKVFEQLRNDQQNINVIYQETVPLAASLRAGIFGPDSIFAKTILSTLEPDQATQYQNFLYERSLFRHQAKTRLAIANLDQSVGFTSEQRRKILELVLRETKPSDKAAAQYEAQVVLLKIAKISDTEVKKILDEPRLKAWNQQLQQARGMERFLKQNGYLDEIEPRPSTKTSDTKKP